MTTSRAITVLRHALPTSACYAAFSLVVVPVVLEPPNEVSSGAWSVVALSMLAGLLVLGYHAVAPAHPKFTVPRWRRWTLRVHISAGTIELLAGLAIFVLNGGATASVVMAIAALFLHLPTSLILTPTVFGARAIMWPSYLLAMGLHGLSAAMLLVHPGVMFWAVSTFLLLSIFAWVRVFYFAFDVFGLFAGSRYSAAVVLAGATILPSLFGPLSVLLIFVSCLVYVLVYRRVFPDEPPGDLISDRSLDGVFLYPAELLADIPLDGDLQSAEEVFKAIGGRSGLIELSKVEDALRNSEVANEVVDQFLSRQARQGDLLSLADFVERVWVVPSLRDTCRIEAFLLTERSDREKADFVFEMLDLDRDHQIGGEELRHLLHAWGLPKSETAAWLRRANGGTEAPLTKPVFFKEMSRVWRHIYREVIEGRHGSRPNKLRRAILGGRRGVVDLIRKQRLSSRLGRPTSLLATVRGLLASHGFPQIADFGEDLIHDLVAASVQHQLAPGEVVFDGEQAGQSVWCVLSGSITVEMQGGEQRVIDRTDWIRPGADGSLTAIAREATVVLRMDAHSFDELRVEYSQLQAARASAMTF